jgi:hypothetical protein
LYDIFGSGGQLEGILHGLGGRRGGGKHASAGGRGGGGGGGPPGGSGRWRRATRTRPCSRTPARQRARIQVNGSR